MQAMHSARVRTAFAQDEPVRILIVDDDQYFRQMLKIILLAQGYEVLEARSTNERESFLRHRPDLAIVDYRLPGTDGAVWIKTLRDRGLKFPIVFCSGSSYSSQVLANLRNVLQVELIVRKPIAPREFVNQIQSLLPLPYIADLPGLASVQSELAQAETQNLPLSGEPEPVEAREAVKEVPCELLTEIPRLSTKAVSPEFHLSQTLDNKNVHFDSEPIALASEPLISDFLNQLFTDQEQMQANLAPDLASEPKEPKDPKDPYEDEFAQNEAERQETEFALRELSQSYLEDMPSIVDSIKADLFQASETDQLTFVELAVTHAHSMRGTSGSLGFFEISKIAAALEDRLKDVIKSDNLKESLTEVLDLTQFLQQSIFREQANQNTAVTAYRIVPKPMKEKPESAGVSSKPLRVLVIDDGFGESGALCLSLRNNHHCETVAITDPVKVLSLLDQYKPQLLFIGTNTDGKSGYDLCRMIRCNQKWWDLPLIMMSEDCSTETRAEIFDSGATDFIARPIIEAELRARLNAYLYTKKSG